ncbi:hypothetical protein BDV37DRAFT_135553 [Aspergillus pseudonomiae]|uniref:Uncharacterized protein n=1 Tax=Aspergillus pseudonomiae TaxID=1506151 RepID=A0A5N7DBF4_9EURO|nr:uncharacterized protein BDV37DRAFT_135553 [Aspergillus pseudonomiae]KAE8403485.1 hypothetical protein BDV37DRAFT_135553 [Aspergillus pseudonomiae]
MGGGRFLGLAWHYIDLVHIFHLLFSLLRLFSPSRSFSICSSLPSSILFFAYLSFYFDHLFLQYFLFASSDCFTSIPFPLVFLSSPLSNTLLLHDPSKFKYLATSYQTGPQSCQHRR